MACNREQKPCVDEWVEVRSKEEILKTLDSQGRRNGMPFMPEMFQFCGMRFRVFKSAHKTCDYTTQLPYRCRTLNETVHLETRCDGSAHDGCQASCLLYWNAAWLKPAGETPNTTGGWHDGANLATNCECTESAVWENTKVEDPQNGSPKYLCQATLTPGATEPLAWWDVRQYWEDYRSGNVCLKRLFQGFIYAVFYQISDGQYGLQRLGLEPIAHWLYNKLRPLWGGSKFPRTPGRIPAGDGTPAASLNLQPGELVRVKPHMEILKTVDATNRNRGMYWDAELVPYCGGTYRVRSRVNKLIDEKTSKMVEMKTPCIILEGVVCQARYSTHRMLCPKGMYPYWREIWLERVETPAEAASFPQECAAPGERIL